MRGALHVIATLATVPYLLLAAAFSIGGHAIGAGSLWNALDTLLAHFLWIVPWGAIGFAVVVIAVAVLGAYPPTRRLGGLLLALLAGIALVVIVALGSGPLDGGQLLFLVPCALVLACGAWLASTAPPSPATAA
jgi:hypothetical protein